jgi:hypothetical protein
MRGCARGAGETNVRAHHWASTSSDTDGTPPPKGKIELFATVPGHRSKRSAQQSFFPRLYISSFHLNATNTRNRELWKGEGGGGEDGRLVSRNRGTQTATQHARHTYLLVITSHKQGHEGGTSSIHDGRRRGHGSQGRLECEEGQIDWRERGTTGGRAPSLLLCNRAAPVADWEKRKKPFRTHTVTDGSIGLNHPSPLPPPHTHTCIHTDADPALLRVSRRPQFARVLERLLLPRHYALRAALPLHRTPLQCPRQVLRGRARVVSCCRVAAVGIEGARRS